MLYMIAATDTTYFRCELRKTFGVWGSKWSGVVFMDVNITTNPRRATLFDDVKVVKEFVKKYGGMVIPIDINNKIRVN
ncbi:hypothetical protein BU116_01175 [Staphylococcus xylosus]|uniref:hypothetical protein n=1 Tax=Staphylococcus TaxID=1279 RepID=UPI000E695B84|nr:hypothetical protein [Staphylococcus xylosus]RIM80092.1 hypothetical protein BU116_01175 [Staphylococcus xylosus]